MSKVWIRFITWNGVGSDKVSRSHWFKPPCPPLSIFHEQTQLLESANQPSILACAVIPQMWVYTFSMLQLYNLKACQMTSTKVQRKKVKLTSLCWPALHFWPCSLADFHLNVCVVGAGRIEVEVTWQSQTRLIDLKKKIRLPN